MSIHFLFITSIDPFISLFPLFYPHQSPAILQSNLMARTKQTARYAVARPVARQSIQAVGRAGHQGGRRSRSRSASQESAKSNDINTQQFSVKFDNQKECEAKAIPFAVVECPKCGAYLNSHSVIIQKEARKSRERNMSDEEKQIYKAHLGKEWECEFCMSINALPDNFEKLPDQNQCYLLEKAEENRANEEPEKENLLLYCIDVSGSMDMEFQGKSRLEAVKEAIVDEVKRMKFEKEKTKVGIITFGSLVSVYTGKESINIPAQHYDSFDAIIQDSRQLKDFSFSLANSFKNLKEFVAELSTYGSTALGPGLLTSIELASTGRKGSKIILCTDGQANIGLNGPEFYTKAAEYAKQKGVVVNILSIKGDRCNLKELGKLTLSTGGSILKIDPSLLGSEFNKISKEEILGSQSVLKIIVNKMFEIENGVGQISKDRTALTQNYGSFSAQTQLTFNFKTLSKEQAAAKGVVYDLFANKNVPMQIQLTYITPSGNKYLQVITDYRILSENKEDLYKEMNFGLFAASTLQKVSAFIRDERFDEAGQEIKSYQKIVADVFEKKETKEKLEKFNGRVQKLSKILESKKSKKHGKTGKGKSKKSAGKSSLQPTKTIRKGKQKASQVSDEEESESNMMASDSEEEVLYMQMRARSASVDRD